MSNDMGHLNSEDENTTRSRNVKQPMPSAIIQKNEDTYEDTGYNPWAKGKAIPVQALWVPEG